MELNKVFESIIVVHCTGIGCGPKYSLSQLVALSQHVALSQLAAAGGEENGVCRTSLRPCRQHYLKLCRFFIHVCVVSCGERAEMRGLVGEHVARCESLSYHAAG